MTNVSVTSPALPPARPVESAPAELRLALAELVQIGLSVARMVGRVADAEADLPVVVDEGVPAVAGSLAEAIEADRASAAAAEGRASLAARVEVVAGAYARVARSIRLTVLLAERMDRGWARRDRADDRAEMARRQVARGIADAIAREADGVRAESLREEAAERLERLDVERELADWPAEAIIARVCRDLGLDPARMVVAVPLPGLAAFAVAGARPSAADGMGASRPDPFAGSGLGRGGLAPERRPDG